SPSGHSVFLLRCHWPAPRPNGITCLRMVAEEPAAPRAVAREPRPEPVERQEGAGARWRGPAATRGRAPAARRAPGTWQERPAAPEWLGQPATFAWASFVIAHRTAGARARSSSG